MENNERELCADDGIANEEKDLEVQDKQPSTTNDRIDRRDSNIELLRIVSMLMIIAHHLVYHGNIMEHVSGNTLSLILNGIFLPGGKIAYDCFIFISAWYIVQKPFSGNRYLKIALEVIFYNIVGMALATLLNGGMIEPITWRNWLGCFLPIFGISHGFAVYYLIFLIILPILQKMTGGEDVSKLNLIMLAILFMMMDFGSKIVNYVIDYDGFADLTSGLSVFVIIYLMSVYLQKWPINFFQKKFLVATVFVGIWACIAIVDILSFRYQDKKFLLLIQAAVSGETSPLNILAGACLFFFFKNIKMKKIKAINVIASHTFGVLLLHDHSYFRYIMWERVFCISKIYASAAYIQLLYTIVVTIVVLVAGTLVDILRVQLLEKPMSKTKLYRKTCTILEKCFKL